MGMCTPDERLVTLDQEVVSLTRASLRTFTSGQLAWVRGDMAEAERLLGLSDALSQAADEAQVRLDAVIAELVAGYPGPEHRSRYALARVRGVRR